MFFFLSFFFVLNHINVPVLTHAGHIGTDRSLLMGHNALLLRQTTFYMHYRKDMVTHETPLLNQSSALLGTS